LFVTLSAIGIMFGLAVANRPRFWWQELFQNYTLVWVFPALLAVYALLQNMRRTGRFSWVTVLVVIAYLYAVLQMVHRVRRYIHFAHWAVPQSATVSVSGVWIDSFSSAAESEVLTQIVSRYSPTLVMVHSEGLGSSLLDVPPLAKYPFHASTAPSADGTITVFSKLPFTTPQMTDLGFEALPGGLITLKLSQGQALELGVLALTRSVDTASFERNRITSRRLSSLMRNSSAHRIVVGNFNSTPFSMLSSIYNEQAGMHSLVFGGSFAQVFSALSGFSSSGGRNVFVARDCGKERFEFIKVPHRAAPIILFAATIPGGE
jgi:hypothetical protein